MRLFLAPLALLAACSSPLDGTWAGVVEWYSGPDGDLQSAISLVIHEAPGLDHDATAVELFSIEMEGDWSHIVAEMDSRLEGTISQSSAWGAQTLASDLVLEEVACRRFDDGVVTATDCEVIGLHYELGSAWSPELIWDGRNRIEVRSGETSGDLQRQP